MISPAVFAAWFILLSLSLLPLPLNGIANGLILYGLLANYTMKAAKPQLGDRPSTPLPALATALGGILLICGLIIAWVLPVVPQHLAWLISAGITLMVYSMGMLYIRKRQHS